MAAGVQRAVRAPQEFISSHEVTFRNSTLRKVALFGVLLGGGLLLSYFWVGVGVALISGQAYRYISRIDSSQKLIEAADNNSKLKVKILLFLGANPNIEPRNSALQRAASNGYCGVVRDLLAAGANPNIRDHFDRTPLSVAADNSQDEAVAILLEAGADKTIRTRGLNPAGTPLDYAIANQRMFQGGMDASIWTDQRSREQRIVATNRIIEMLR